METLTPTPEEHYRDYVTVSDASAILGVSIDTIRRWEKAGKLHAERLDGKNRYFAEDELLEFKRTLPLTTSKIASLLGVSASTVRRLESEGALTASRESNGRRVYTQEAVESYIAAKNRPAPIVPATGVPIEVRTDQDPSQQIELKSLQESHTPNEALFTDQLESAKKTDKPEHTHHSLLEDSAGAIAPLTPLHFKNDAKMPEININNVVEKIYRNVWAKAAILVTAICTTLILLFIALFLLFPDKMSELMGYNKDVTSVTGNTDKPFLAYLAQPFADPALGIVSIVNPALADSIKPDPFVPENTLPLSGGDSDSVGGLKPGVENGNLGVLPIHGKSIKDKTITNVQIADGTIQLGNLSPGLVTSLKSGGSAGARGATGATGPAGAAGTTGATGPQGVAGPQGNQGPQGPAGAGDIDDVVAGLGLSGGGSTGAVTLQVATGTTTEIINDTVEVKLATNGTTGTTSSVSGLEVTNQGLRLVSGCSNGQILKWNGASWACAADSSGGGGGAVGVQTSDGNTVVASATNIQFGPTTSSTNEFVLTNLGSGQVRVQLGGNVLQTGNYSTTLDPTYVNATETPSAGDISGSFTTGFSVTADAVALGSDTTGNFVASLAGGNGFVVTGSGTESAAVSINLDITTTGTTGTISSNSGLELTADGLRLVGGCSSGQVLKWNGSTWLCSNDATGSGAMDIKESGTTVTASASALDFLGSDFTVTNTAGQAGVVLDYANSGITRRSGTELINGNWSFNDSSFTIQDNADNSKKVMFDASGIAAGATRTLTVPNVSGTLITSGNLSDINSVGVIGSGTWQGSIVGTAYGGTGINSATAGNGTLLIGNGSGYTLGTLTQGSGISISNASGNITIASTLGASVGNSEVDNDAVTLGTQTTGAYVSTLGTLAGLSVTGNSGEGSTPNLSVLYGSGANTAVQGNTSISVTAGTNLSGGGSITLGTGGSVTLNSVANPSFGTSVTSPLFTNAGAVTLSTTGAGNDLTLSSADQIIFTGFNCSTFNNGGVLTVNASGVLSCDNDDGGAVGSVTGSGTANRLTMFSGASTIADSWLAQNVSTLEIDNTRNLSLLGGNLSVTGTGSFSSTLSAGGLFSANGGLTIETGDTFTINGDALTDLTGTGIINSGGTLQASLGTSVSNGEIDNDAVTLGTQTTGAFVSTIGTLLGLSTTGNSGEASTPTLSVLYGSTASTAVQGNTTLTCASGTGNLTGGGTVLTLGTGGTCGAISTNNAVSFTTSVSTPLVTNAGVLTLSTTGANDLTVSSGSNLLNLGATTVRTTSGLSYDLNNVGATVFAVTNSNTGTASLTVEGGGSFGGNLNVTTGGITVTGNSSITGTLTGLTGLTVASGGASLSGGLNNNNGGITGAGSIDGATTITASGNINTSGGAIQTNGTTRIGNDGSLSNVTASTAILTSGTLGSARGGTGVDGSAAANGSLLIGNGTGFSLGTLTQGSGIGISNAAGSITIAATLGTTISNGEIDNDAVTLGTQTTGSYVASLGALTGLSTTGNSGEGSNPTLAVLYGSTASTAVQGNTQVTCASGSGNLSGGGNTLTLGSGGTCGTITIGDAVSFATSVTTPLLTNAGALTISTTGSNDLSLTSGSGILNFNASTLRRSAGGTTMFDLLDATGATTLSVTNSSGAQVANLNVEGTVTAATFSGALSGNATTATSLAANPTDCAANQFATTIAANGNLTCASITDADVPDTITINNATNATNLIGSGSTTNAVDLGTAEVAGTLADGNVSDTLTVGSSSTVADAALSANVTKLGATITKDEITNSGVLGFTWSDSEVADTLTIGASSTVADAALSANVTKLGNSIDLNTETTANLLASRLQSAATDLGGADVNIILTNSNAGGFVTNLTLDGTVTAATFSGALSGNATTATSLAANPTDCAANQFATTIAANGNLTCASITDADVPNSITVDLSATATALAANPTDCAANQFATTIAANGNLTCASLTDGDVPDTLTIGASSTVADGALSANVTKLGGAIDLAGSEVAGNLRAINLQNAGADLGAANVNIDLSNTNGGGFVTNLTLDGTVTAATFSGNLTGNVSGNVNGNVTGNADTATALAANPTDCATDTYATTIAANGNLTCASITDAALSANVTKLGNSIDLNTETTANLLASRLQSAATDLGGADVNIILTNSNAGGFVTNLTLDGTVTAATFSGALSGNATTATSLAANPTDCAANQFATTIAANGNLTCASITDADVPDTITINNATNATNLIGSGSTTNAVDLGTAEVAGTLGVARGGTGVDGSTTANGSLLIGNGSGYTLTTLTQGTGISIANAAGSITIAATLGTSISNGEIDSDAVTLGTQTSGSYVASFTAGNGLTGDGSGEGSTPTIAVASANGGIVVGSDNIALTIQSSGDALSTTTASGSGLEVLAGGLSLLQGCANNEIIKWNEATDVWACSADAAGGVTDGDKGDITASASGATWTIDADSVALGTDTTGNFVAGLTAGNGISVGGSAGEGWSPSVAVLYGSTANTAVEGNTSITVSAGTNLSGGGSITLGGGGTVTLNTVVNPTFSTSVTTPLVTSSANLAVTAGGTGTLMLNTSDSTTVSTAGVTIKSGDASSGANLSAGTVRIDTGTKTGSGTGQVSIADVNATSLGLGRTGITTTNNGALTVSQSLTANGGASVASNQNLTLQSGTGSFSQTYVNASSGNAQTLSIINSNNGGSAVAVNGLDLTLVGTATSGGINTNTAIRFSDPSAVANNVFYALNFAGTGYTDILRVGSSQIVSGAGKLQNAGLDSAITYSNINGVGALSAGSIASGFGTIATANTITGTTLNGTAGINTGASAGTQRIDSSGNLVNIGNITGTAGITMAGSGTGTLIFNTANSTSASTGAITLQSGSASTGANLSAGTVSIDTGTRTGTGTAILNLGNTNSMAINFGNSGSSFTFTGNSSSTFVINGTTVNATEFNRLDGTTAALVDQDDFISADGAGSAGNGSGLEAGAGGIGLLQGCTDTQILKWTETGSTWNCAADGISDARLKKDVATLDSNVLAKLDGVHLVNFNFDCQSDYFQQGFFCDTRSQTGVIAQELEQLFPELVYTESDGYKRVRYEALNIYVLKAVQELNSKTEDLKKEVEAVKAFQANQQQIDLENLEVGNLRIAMDLFTEGALTVSGEALFKGSAIFEQLAIFNGEVQFNSTTSFNGEAKFSNNNGGYAVINTGQQTVHVSFASPYSQLPIISVSLSDGKFAKYSYQNVTPDGFDIVLEQASTESLQFSWIALSVTNPSTAAQ